MKVRIYVSPKTADTLWIKQSMRAISSEIMQKRYTPVFLEATDPEKLNFDEIYEPGERRLLIYAGASAAITPRLLSRFSECGVHGIFINYESSVLSGRYSKIFLDYRDGMRKIINYLTAAGRSEFALYGINPNSATDLIKDSFFCEYLRRDGKNPTRDIYYNYASLTGCFSRFCENCARYDAVICANDVVALSLISHLREVGVAVPEDLYVVSFGSSVLASLSAPTITSVIVDHAELGRQTVLAYAYLYKNPGDISLTVKVDAKLVVRASTDKQTPLERSDVFSSFLQQTPDLDFYDDPVTQRIFRAETLLSGCDELDFGILEGVLGGDTYPRIAERLYTSENVISYRIRRMCRTTGCQKKSELVALLAPYIDKDSIGRVIGK